MTNEQILEQQVEALEKLLQLRSAIIQELEAKVSNLENEAAKLNAQPYPYVPNINVPWISTPYTPQVYTPFQGGGSGTITITNINNCPDGTPHQYPHVLNGANQACTKCGQGQWNVTGTTMGGSNITLTGNTIVGGGANSVPVHTSGYVAPVSTNYAFQDSVFTLVGAAK